MNVPPKPLSPGWPEFPPPLPPAVAASQTLNFVCLFCSCLQKHILFVKNADQICNPKHCGNWRSHIWADGLCRGKMVLVMLHAWCWRCKTLRALGQNSSNKCNLSLKIWTILIILWTTKLANQEEKGKTMEDGRFSGNKLPNSSPSDVWFVSVLLQITSSKWHFEQEQIIVRGRTSIQALCLTERVCKQMKKFCSVPNAVARGIWREGARVLACDLVWLLWFCSDFPCSKIVLPHGYSIHLRNSFPLSQSYRITLCFVSSILSHPPPAFLSADTNSVPCMYRPLWTNAANHWASPDYPLAGA